MNTEEARAWLRLLLTPGVGPTAVRRWLAALGSPQAVCQASATVLGQIASPREAAILAAPGDEVCALVEEHVRRVGAWLAAAPCPPSRHLLSLGDAHYPGSLLDLADPPLLLFAEGDLNLLQAPALAVVGSRHATAQGLDHARDFSRALSASGVTIVSGLARGIDAAAHEGALDGQLLLAPAGRPGGTIAVVGTGLDQVYPKAHARLAQAIASRGLMLSEFPLGTPPLRGNFPKRNRLVAALSRGTLVVEAAVQSGSLITARLAAELGREVMAIPGSIHAPQARGCHALIKQGARLVETADEVLEELGLGALAKGAAVGAASASAPADASSSAAPSEDDALLSAMGHDPVSQEALSARTGLGPAELGARLLELELMGKVARLPGALFQRRRAA
ncbi:MAG: DNA-processing protein DprA [Aquabacterium sp.]|jgi:DNA processing protein